MAAQDLIRSSGKDLGQLALPGACARCFWLSRTVSQLPYREFSNRLPAPLILIKKTDAQLPPGKEGVSLQLGGLEALKGITAALGRLRR
jgi:hypothetical protein